MINLKWSPYKEELIKEHWNKYSECTYGFYKIEIIGQSAYCSSLPILYSWKLYIKNPRNEYEFFTYGASRDNLKEYSSAKTTFELAKESAEKYLNQLIENDGV